MRANVLERLGLHTLSQTVASFREDTLARSPSAGVLWLAREREAVSSLVSVVNAADDSN